MKKQISLLLVFVALLTVKAMAQPVKFSQFPAKDVTPNTYMVGTYDSVPGAPKNAKFKVPFTYRNSDNRIKIPTLSAGMVQIGDSGKVSTRTFDSLVYDRWFNVYRPYISYNTYYTLGPGHGNIDVDFTWWVDSLDRSFHMKGYLYVNSPADFPDPPARMAIPLISWNHTSNPSPVGLFGSQATVVAGLFSADPAMLPMYGGGYFSTIDLVADDNPITIITTINAYMVKPANTVSEYIVLFNITIPR
ncbi:hypothetical protein CJD36_019815 [Flavipsychrobacter stenotrophus]|uniref:DUF5020 domain-containing protein n=1 Tax=Flavipsychrobacter stenotrophus TaxID=2077091 RepID=A0A2S7SRF8_9BACT|nr:hypothetical protein [Flavipsychrobacter stenotrophus]PQJ09489.1 hypothetical protein CJD36_019815 [Flavipsychrobacter stenotrophus]